MRLLHVVPTYVPAYRHGGPIVAVHGLCKALVARGHTVSVFTTDVDGSGRLDVPHARPVDLDGVAVAYFPVVGPTRLYWARGLRAALAATVSRVDLVHLHSVFLWPTSAAAREAERHRTPYVVSPRGMLVPALLRRRGRLRKSLWLRLVERRTLRRAAAIHFTSALEEQEARATGLALPAGFVVPNGVVVEAVSPDAPIASRVRDALARRPTVAFLGRLSWKKGLERLVRALPSLPTATALLAGPDDEALTPRLEELARELGVRDRVVFLGALAGADKAALLSGADVFVLPSLSENFGNAVLEAMAAARPVVVTREVGLAAEIAAAGAGMVVEGTPAALAAAVGALLANPEGRQDLGRRGQELVAGRFGWAAVAERMERAYETVVHDREGGG